MPNLLASLFDAKPSDAPLGSGMAESAKNALILRQQYRQYVIDAQSNGEQPLDFNTWASQVNNG